MMHVEVQAFPWFFNTRSLWNTPWEFLLVKWVEFQYPQFDVSANLESCELGLSLLKNSLMPQSNIQPQIYTI